MDLSSSTSSDHTMEETEEHIDTSLQARLKHLSSSVLASNEIIIDNNTHDLLNGGGSSSSTSLPSSSSPTSLFVTDGGERTTITERNAYDNQHNIDDEEEEEEEEEMDNSATAAKSRGKKSKGQLKKEKQKRKAASTVTASLPSNIPPTTTTVLSSSTTIPTTASTPEIIIEYTLPTLDHVQDPELLALMKHFLPDSIVNAAVHDVNNNNNPKSSIDNNQSQPDPSSSDEEMDNKDNIDHDEEDMEEHKNMFDQMGGAKLSKKQYKRLFSLFVASLKREVSHPEIVEAHDVTSLDPKLLITLKSLRNTVPVPRHWSHKRKYLQGKRGFEKPPFQLPEFIVNTGITKMRNEDIDTQENKSLKSKTRDRVRPKMGRIEIDYNILRDAFFIHQTKPKLTTFGEIYYEGKEEEKSYNHLKPGKLSDRLKLALGLPIEKDKINPPPWLINMQRYGPPRSYPYLRIPGLNAPIPSGQNYGYGPGEWGKPPVDEYGNPLYGDVFGMFNTYASEGEGEENIKDNINGTGSVKRYWGEIIDDDTTEIIMTQKQINAIEESSLEKIATVPVTSIPATEEEMGDNKSIMDGTASVPYTITSGMETPAETLQLRKGTTSVQPQDTQPKHLYTVLEEKQTALTGSLLGTRTMYVIPSTGSTTLSVSNTIVPGTEDLSTTTTTSTNSSRTSATEFTVNLSPEELAKLDESEIAKKYAEAQAAQTAALQGNKEDMTDLFDEQERKKKRKTEKTVDDKVTAKKKKDFKF